MIAPRILIVEDDPDIALALRMDLTNEGYAIDVVSDGAEAARRAHDPSWDLILLDVMLPTTDGLEVCRQLRLKRIRTPVLMLTAKTQEADKILGLDSGADDYVIKPFSPRELRARIRALLRRVAPEEPLQQVGDREVDFARAQVRTVNGCVDLTPIELGMLQLFLRSPRRVVSREHIIDAVWGHDVFVTDRVVDTHVMKLRRKVEADPSRPRHILSVRGLGYRYEP
jgi:two-component system alkaline phosphatase synthesis response regulator PhoP